MATAVYRAQISAEMLGMTLSELKQLKDLLDNINNGKIKISGDTKNIKNVSQTIEKIKTLMGGIEDVQIGESVFDEGKINAQAHDISDGLEQIFKGQTIYLPMDCDQSELMDIHDRVQKVFEDKIPIRFELDMSIPNIMKELDDFSNEIGGDLKSKIESSTWGYTSSNIVDILKRTLGEKNILPTEENLMNAIDKISSSILDWDEKKFKSGEMYDPFKFSELLKKYKDMFALQTKLRREYQNYDTDVMGGFEDGVYFEKLKPKYMSYLEGRYSDYYQTILSFIRNFEDLRYGYIDRAVDEGYDANSQWYENMVDADEFEELQESLDKKKEKINKLKQQLEVSKNMILELSNDQDELKKRYDDMQREFMDLFESNIKNDNGSGQANIENLEEFITGIGNLINRLNTIIGDGDADKFKKDIGFIISSMKELMGISDISEDDLMSWGKNSEVIDKKYIKNIDWLSNYISQHEEYIRLSKKLGKQYELDYSNDKIAERYESSDKSMSFEDFRTKELQEYKENVENNNRTIEKELSEIERLKKEREEKLNKLKKIYDKDNGGILNSIKDSLNNIVENRLGSKSDDSGNNLSKFLEVMFPKEEDIIAFKERIDLFINSFNKLFQAFGTLESESSSNNIFGFIKSIKEMLPDIKEAIASVSMNIDLGNSFDDSSMGKIVERQENYLRAYRNQLQEMKRIKGEVSKQSFGKAYKSNALESQVNRRLNMFNEDDYETFDDKIVAYKKLIEDMEAASLKTYGRNIYANMDKSFARKVSTAKGSITRQTNASEQKAKNRLANIFGVNVGEDNSKSLSGIENSFTSLLNRIDELIVKVQMLSDAFMGLNNISLMPKIGEDGRFDVIRNNVEEFKKLVEEINIKNIDKFDDDPDSFTKYMNGSNELDYKLIPQNVKNIIDSISEELSIGRITLDEAIEKYKQSFNELFNIKDESSKPVNITDDKNNINDANEKIVVSESDVARLYLAEADASKELTSELEKLGVAKTNLIIANNFYTGHKFDDVVKAEGKMAEYASEQFERLATAKGKVDVKTIAEAQKELEKEEKKKKGNANKNETKNKDPYAGLDYYVKVDEEYKNLGQLLGEVTDGDGALFKQSLEEALRKQKKIKDYGDIERIVDRTYLNQLTDEKGEVTGYGSKDKYRTVYTKGGSYQFKYVPKDEKNKISAGWIIQNTQDTIFDAKEYEKDIKTYERVSKNISKIQKEYMADNVKYSVARMNGTATDIELEYMRKNMESKRKQMLQEKEHLKFIEERLSAEDEEKKRIDAVRMEQTELNKSNAKLIYEQKNNKIINAKKKDEEKVSKSNNSEFEKQLNGIKAQEKLMKEAEKRYQDAMSSNSSTPEQIEQLKNSYDNQVKVLTRLREEAMSFANSSYGIVDAEKRIADAIIEANSAFEKQQRLESDKQVAKDIKAQKKGQETDYKKSLQEYQRVSNKIVQINRQIENSKAKQKWGDDTGNYTLEEMSRLKEIEKKNKELLDIEEKKRSAIETRLKESKKYNEEEVNAIDNIREKQLDLNKKNAEYSFFYKNVGNQERSSKKTENAKLKSENKAEFERQLREIEHKQELINKLTQDIQNGEKTELNKEVLGNWRNELGSYEKDLEELKKNLIEFSNSAYGIEENVSDEIEKRIKKVNDKKLESENQQGRTDAIKDAKARRKQNISDYEKEVKNIESLYESYNSKIADLADKQLSGKLLNADFEKLSGKIKDLKKDIDEAKRNLIELEETGDIDDDLIRKSAESIEKARIAKRNSAKESIENSRKKYDEVAENKAREEREKARKQEEKQAQKDAEANAKNNQNKNQIYERTAKQLADTYDKVYENYTKLQTATIEGKSGSDIVKMQNDIDKLLDKIIELRETMDSLNENGSISNDKIKETEEMLKSRMESAKKLSDSTINDITNKIEKNESKKELKEKEDSYKRRINELYNSEMEYAKIIGKGMDKTSDDEQRLSVLKSRIELLKQEISLKKEDNDLSEETKDYRKNDLEKSALAIINARNKVNNVNNKSDAKMAYKESLDNLKKYQEEYANLFKKLEFSTDELERTSLIDRMNKLEFLISSAIEGAEVFGSFLKSDAEIADDLNKIFEKIDNSVSKVKTSEEILEEKRMSQLEKLGKQGTIYDAYFKDGNGKIVGQKDTKEIVSNYLTSLFGYSSEISKFKVANLTDDGVITGSEGFAKFTGEVRNATGELVKFIIKYDALNDKMAISTVTEGLGLKFDFKDNLNGSADEVSEAIKKAGDLSKRLNDINKKYESKFNNDPLALESFTDDIEKLKTAFSELADGGDISEFYKRLNNLTKETNDFDKKYAILAKQIRGESLEDGLFEKQKDVEKYLSKYAKENNLGEINGDVRVNRLNNGIVQVIGYARDFNDEVTKITANWSDLTGRMSVSTVDMGQQLTGLAGWVNSLGKRMYTLSQYWFSMYFSPMDLMRYARTIISSVTELDTAMIDLQKTAKMTGGELNQVYDSASEKASKFGITTQEYIQATADMSRAGFSTYKEATTMADATALFTAISPDVEASESATGLVSILRAFDIESENIKDEVLSKINVIGKNNCLNIW